VLGQRGGDGAALQRRYRAAVVANTCLPEHRGGFAPSRGMVAARISYRIMSYHVSHRVSDCVVSFRSPMTTLARDQRQAAIISRDGSSKNRNLVYLSAHRTASSRIISPSLLSPLRMFRSMLLGLSTSARMTSHVCTYSAHTVHTVNQMGMCVIRARRKKGKRRGWEGKESERGEGGDWDVMSTIRHCAKQLPALPSYRRIVCDRYTPVMHAAPSRRFITGT